MFTVTTLTTIDEAVIGPAGTVYSTGPKTALGDDGHSYFVKGPDLEIVFAELTGNLLAEAVGIPVPDVAACSFGGSIYAGSRKVADLGRNLLPWLTRRNRITNYADLYGAIVVDAWLGNFDRNMGNVVGKNGRGGNVDLVMIDFEKSVALRTNPLISCGMLDPRTLWPTNELGDLLRRGRPLSAPPAMVNRICAFAGKRVQIEQLVTAVTDAVGPIPWSDGSVEALSRRGARIAELAGEVWLA
jgi:hypothetical protein